MGVISASTTKSGGVMQCSVEGCEREAKTRGWCGMHYSRWRANGTTELQVKEVRVCSIGGCDRPYLARGLCAVHYQRSERLGDPATPTRSYQARGAACSVEGCERAVYGKGWCLNHYEHNRLLGDPLAKGPGQGNRPKKPKVACSVEGCESLAHSKGLCSLHRYRLKAHGDPLATPKRIRRGPGAKCLVEGCDKPIDSHGWCSMHLYRARALGDPLASPKRVPRYNGEKCSVEGCEKLARNKGLCTMHAHRMRVTGEVGPAQSMKAPWGTGYINQSGYRQVYVERKSVLEHRVVMEGIIGRPLEPFENVHHLNGDRADNRRENLELWIKPQLPGQRARDLVAYAHWIVETYGRYVEAEQLRLKL